MRERGSRVRYVHSGNVYSVDFMGFQGVPPDSWAVDTLSDAGKLLVYQPSSDAVMRIALV